MACAWDSNPGPQDERERRRIERADDSTEPNNVLIHCFFLIWISFEGLTRVPQRKFSFKKFRRNCFNRNGIIIIIVIRSRM